MQVNKLFKNYLLNNQRLEWWKFEPNTMDYRTKRIYDAFLAVESAEKFRENSKTFDQKMRAQALIMNTLDNLLKEIKDLKK